MGSRRFGWTALPWMGGLALALFACGGGKASEQTDTPAAQSHSSLMRRATSCDDLTRALQLDITARVQLAVRNQGTYRTGGIADMAPSTGFGGSVSSGMGGSSGFVGSAGATAMPGAAGSSGGSYAAGGAGGGGGATTAGPAFTQTNTQVAGVDEADFVKSDGVNLYVVRDRMLYVVTAWPVDALAERTHASIDGRAFELYVVGDAGSGSQRIVVYSVVDAQTVYAQAGLGSSGAAGFARSAPVAYGGSADLIKATVLSFAGGALSVESEVYLEGRYVSSRRTGNLVRTVLEVERSVPGLRTYPTPSDEHRADLLVLERLQRSGRSVADLSDADFDAMYSQALADVIASDNRAVIASLSAERWVPNAFLKRNGGTMPIALPLPCDDFFIPATGSGSIGVTYVADIDLTKLGQAPQGIAILAKADTMYQNASALVLAAQDWEAGGGNFTIPHTFVHRFEYGESEPLVYRASGLVSGEIHDQFAIDEKAGDVRLVTTENGSSGRVNRLYVMKSNGVDLATVGQVGSFAPGEDVMAVRFVGDTAYVVTFRQKDPLFVFDLADATRPALLGELTIEGFSEYMHPLDENHILTVGQSGVGTVALKLFDVTDKTKPKLMPGDYAFSRYGTTEASVTHKAVTFFRERGLLALPFSGEVCDAFAATCTIESSLELFRVSLAAGIQSIGGVPGAALVPVEDPNAWCAPYLKEEGSRFLRGQFIDTVVYGVARDGIVASDVSAPQTVKKSLKLGNSCVDGDSVSGGTGGDPWGGGTGGWIGAGGWTGTGGWVSAGGAANFGGSGGATDFGGAGGVGGDTGTGGSGAGGGSGASGATGTSGAAGASGAGGSGAQGGV
jgi:hypothetical protein